MALLKSSLAKGALPVNETDTFRCERTNTVLILDKCLTNFTTANAFNDPQFVHCLDCPQGQQNREAFASYGITGKPNRLPVDERKPCPQNTVDRAVALFTLLKGQNCRRRALITLMTKTWIIKESTASDWASGELKMSGLILIKRDEKVYRIRWNRQHPALVTARAELMEKK